MLDEPMMLSVKLPDVPIVVGADRVAAARHYLNRPNVAQPQVWILDDGFQHRRLKRDVDALVFGALSRSGNTRLFPAGFLREPMGNCRRADLVFLRQNDEVPLDTQFVKELHALGIKNILPVKHQSFAPVTVAGSQHFSEVSSFACIAAIANPLDFKRSCEVFGIKIKNSLFKSDHDRFEISEIEKTCAGCDGLITTEKDYYRDQYLFNGLNWPVFVLPLNVDVNHGEIKQHFGIILDSVKNC